MTLRDLQAREQRLRDFIKHQESLPRSKRCDKLLDAYQLRFQSKRGGGLTIGWAQRTDALLKHCWPDEFDRDLQRYGHFTHHPETEATLEELQS